MINTHQLYARLTYLCSRGRHSEAEDELEAALNRKVIKEYRLLPPTKDGYYPLDCGGLLDMGKMKGTGHGQVCADSDWIVSRHRAQTAQHLAARLRCNWS